MYSVFLTGQSRVHSTSEIESIIEASNVPNPGIRKSVTFRTFRVKNYDGILRVISTNTPELTVHGEKLRVKDSFHSYVVKVKKIHTPPGLTPSDQDRKITPFSQSSLSPCPQTPSCDSSEGQVDVHYSYYWVGAQLPPNTAFTQL